ncbi:MAG: helix-turn-helix transcriptional regulator [Candidatus Limiplasma sp.]|nr:helix-turn-helix transcriptional regulator [Candidatus Limiplasma sp.]
MTVQERVRKRMRQMGWTEYRLAKTANLPQSTISHMFRRNNAPTYSTIEAICGAFGLTLSQFFAEEGEAVILAPEEKELLSLWGRLSSERKNLIFKTMAEFLRDSEG